jgi:hypothetical protein
MVGIVKELQMIQFRRSNTLFILILLLSFVTLVTADACIFYDDDILTIEEFILINDSVLSNFNSALLGNQIINGQNIHIIKMDVYELIWKYEQDELDEWADPTPVPMVIPVLMIYNWYCSDDACDYNEFITEQEAWYLSAYEGIKAPYE